MKTLDDLTPEIEAKIPIYQSKCVDDLYSGVESDNFDPKFSTKYVEKVYEIAGYKKPVVIFADNPIDYRKKFIALTKDNILNDVEKLYRNLNDINSNTNDNELLLEKINNDINGYKIVDSDKSIEIESSYLYLCSTYHRVYLMWYKFIQDEFKIDHSNKETLDWLYEHANNNISRCHFTEWFVLVLRMPSRIVKNNIGLHNAHGAAIQWYDDFKMYYVNGRQVPKELFEKIENKELTFDDFIKLSDEDNKAAVMTIIKERYGDAELINFLNAVVVDSKTITHTSGHKETIRLWKTKEKYDFLSDINGNMNQPYAWMELKCPSTGSIYLIDTSAHFTDALEAAKFHRPTLIPNELRYDFIEFNN